MIMSEKDRRRAFIIVLDSFGVGEEPDAAQFGDEGSNTIRTVNTSSEFIVPNMEKLGLFNIEGVDCRKGVRSPKGAYCRLQELSAGKDTTIGHWEIAGVVSPRPLPTYPEGFPPEIIEELEKRTGRKAVANKPYSGTKVIDEFGEHQMKTGDLIVYTSADSVMQIAAHEEIIPPAELYEICRIARDIMQGEHGVGRIIARPYVGEPGHFTRTANRHDFSLLPPEETALDYIVDAGLDMLAVGKIHDIYAGRGMTEYVYSESNLDGLAKTSAYAQRDFHGLCFVNLVEFDSKYGHRRDIDGYARALAEFDAWLGEFLPAMRENDLLIITADHGCDPGYMKHTDHTREYIPMLAAGPKVKPKNLGTRPGFCDIGATVCDFLSVEADISGKSFLKEIYHD